MKTWFVGVLSPGAAHKAQPRRGMPAARVGETVIERSLADAGFEAYLPSLRREVVNPRSRKVVVRHIPLFTGYVFVAEPPGGMDWPRLCACDGIKEPLAMDGWPLRVPAGYVERVQQAERDEVFDTTTSAKIRRREIGRTQRETSALRFPAGSMVRARRGPFAGFSGLVEDVTGQGLIKVAIQIFSRSTPVEFEAQMLEAI